MNQVEQAWKRDRLARIRIQLSEAPQAPVSPRRQKPQVKGSGDVSVAPVVSQRRCSWCGHLRCGYHRDLDRLYR